MASIKRFEDMKVWQEARIINREIYRVTRNKRFSKDYAMRDQIRRASISISANIVEGYERGATKEFIYFLSIAKGSAGEVLNLLYLALDEQYIEGGEFEILYEKVLILMRRMGSLMKYLKNTDLRGSRYLSDNR